jgi:hypothetical protein
MQAGRQRHHYQDREFKVATLALKTPSSRPYQRYIHLNNVNHNNMTKGLKMKETLKEITLLGC